MLVYDGDVLPLTKVSRNEMGAYLCIATNGVPPSVSKRIILDVECKYLMPEIGNENYSNRGNSGRIRFVGGDCCVLY